MYLRRSTHAAVPAIAAFLAAAALRIQRSSAIAEHKPLWPLDARNYAAGALGALALIAAALGGIGGGGILLPIYLLVLDFRVKQAVALANATIFGGWSIVVVRIFSLQDGRVSKAPLNFIRYKTGGSIANIAHAARRRHPYADRPSTNWTLIMLFEPLVILGSVLGSFGNKLLPDALLQVILVALYGLLSITTSRKAVAQVHTEGGWRSLFKSRPPSTHGDGGNLTWSSDVDEEVKQEETTGLLAGRPRGQSYPPAHERPPPLLAAGGVGGGGCNGGRGCYGSMPTVNHLLYSDTSRDNNSISGYNGAGEGMVASPPLDVKRRVVRKVRFRR